MDVSYELQQVLIFLADYRFVAVLEKMPMPVMPQVEDYCVSS